MPYPAQRLTLTELLVKVYHHQCGLDPGKEVGGGVLIGLSHASHRLSAHSQLSQLVTDDNDLPREFPHCDKVSIGKLHRLLSRVPSTQVRRLQADTSFLL